MASTVEQRAASLFSASMFRPVLTGASAAPVDRLLAGLQPHLRPHSASRLAAIEAAYAFLSRHRRSEYIYKNLIASKVLVGRHRAAKATLIHEFRVGDAVADCVLLNGSATVYEIKTELDRPDKLGRQLAEYFRAFSLVNVVVHESEAEKYMAILPDDPTGVLAVGSRQRLTVVRDPRPYDDELDTRVMFNSLRQAEVENALRHCGVEPSVVPNGIRYARNLELARSVSPAAFHQGFAASLKQRRLQSSTFLKDRASGPLRSLLVQLNPTVSQEQRLTSWLSQKVR